MEGITSRIYLDTCVYNKIAEICTLPIFPGKLKKYCPVQVFLSPMNILEIIQTTNCLKREIIIRILQEICIEQLFAGPELLIVDFIAEKYDSHELDQLELNSPFPKTELSETWMHIKLDPDKTFLFDDSIKKIQILKLLNQLIQTWLKSGGNLENDSIKQIGDYWGMSKNDLVLKMKMSIEEMKKRSRTIRKSWPFCDMLYLLITSILIVGLTPYPEPIDKMWELLNAKTINDKFDLIFNGPLNFILWEGPFVGMAGFMARQISKRYNPGNLFDGFHMVYLPYISEFLTTDTGMIQIAESFTNSPNFSKVHCADTFINHFIIS